MSATKEYYLKLSEQAYNQLDFEQQKYLYSLGMIVKQLPSEEDLSDPNYQSLKKASREAFKLEQEYLFKKRNK